MAMNSASPRNFIDHKASASSPGVASASARQPALPVPQAVPGPAARSPAEPAPLAGLQSPSAAVSQGPILQRDGKQAGERHLVGWLSGPGRTRTRASDWDKQAVLRHVAILNDAKQAPMHDGYLCVNQGRGKPRELIPIVGSSEYREVIHILVSSSDAVRTGLCSAEQLAGPGDVLLEYEMARKEVPNLFVTRRNTRTHVQAPARSIASPNAVWTPAPARACFQPKTKNGHAEIAASIEQWITGAQPLEASLLIDNGRHSHCKLVAVRTMRFDSQTRIASIEVSAADAIRHQLVTADAARGKDSVVFIYDLNTVAAPWLSFDESSERTIAAVEDVDRILEKNRWSAMN